MESAFCCPNCGSVLERTQTQYLCPRGHSFDLAREGYVHLLPANRKHAKEPGDDREMVRARTQFLDGGWYAPLRQALCDLTAERIRGRGALLLDAGCGEGYYTSALQALLGAAGGRVCGVDLSKAAVRKAARRCPGAEIAVASVYHLPLPDASVDVLVNCFSPLAAQEFARVVRPGGSFLYVVPGPRHLWELKQLLYEHPYENEEKQEEYPGFALDAVVPVETGFTLTDNEQIRALFHMTPYTWKTPKDAKQRLEAVQALPLTAQFRIHVFTRRPENEK